MFNHARYFLGKAFSYRRSRLRIDFRLISLSGKLFLLEIKSLLTTGRLLKELEE